MSPRVWRAMAALSSLFLLSTAAAADYVQEAKLSASDGATRDALGEVALSADGATAAAAAPNAKIASNSLQGAVYVFVKPGGGWTGATQTAKLVASDGAAGDQLGPVSISADGSVIVAGSRAAVGGHADQGAAYVFVRPAAGWVDGKETAKLIAAGGAANDNLGVSVTVSGDGSTVVAGAPGATFLDHTAQGVAFLFTRPGGGWVSGTSSVKLIASDGASGDGLGTAAAASSDGSTVVVGAMGASAAGGTGVGAAYVFVRPNGGWTSDSQAAKLTASDGAALDSLGSSVAVSGDGTTAVAGAPNAQILGRAEQGAAYVFTAGSGGWSNSTERAKLTASDGMTGNRLAGSLAVSGDGATVLAAAVSAAEGGNSGQGAAYVFAKPGAGWTTEMETAKLVASDGAAGDAFGYTVALSGDGLTVAGGAPAATNAGNQFQGAAYIFSLVIGGACVPSANTLCLDDRPGDRRWEAAVTFTSSAASGSADAIALASLGVSHGGLFWFFAADNPEMLLKIVDGCALNQSFWVFFSATTNVGFAVTVRDTRTGRGKTYRNSNGTAAPPLQDTSAFACINGDLAPPGSDAGELAQAVAGSRTPPALAPPGTTLGTAVPAATCVSSSKTLCIGGRFQVQVSYRSTTPGSGTAIGLDGLGVTRGGLFWFFGADNPEMLVKVLNGCALNDRFWLFYSATTNVGFTVTATDLQTGHMRVYRNAIGTAAPPVLDTSAFSCN